MPGILPVVPTMHIPLETNELFSEQPLGTLLGPRPCFFFFFFEVFKALNEFTEFASQTTETI